MNSDKLREYCLSLPGTSEGIKWEHVCYMVVEKLFVITSAEDDSFVTFKVPEEDFDVLTERDGVIQAGHMAKRQWVAVTRRSALSRDEWKHYLLQSYNLIRAKLPKKVQKELDAE
jgi:predicted DNA-binding protein (MmcQ/YjbR family)